MPTPAKAPAKVPAPRRSMGRSFGAWGSQKVAHSRFGTVGELVKLRPRHPNCFLEWTEWSSQGMKKNSFLAPMICRFLTSEDVPFRFVCVQVEQPLAAPSRRVAPRQRTSSSQSAGGQTRGQTRGWRWGDLYFGGTFYGWSTEEVYKYIMEDNHH